MTIRICRISSLIILVGLFATLGSLASGNLTMSVQQVVDDILEDFAARKIRSLDAHARLKELPQDEVVAALVVALNRTPRLKEGEGPHNFSYTMLRDLRAAHTEVGYQQLLFGLWVPDVSSICVEALLDAPEAKQEEVLKHIRRYLDETKTPTRPDKTKEGFPSPPSENEVYVGRVLHAIARKGKDALPYVDTLDAMLRDPERNLHVRTAAAVAIVKIKPLPGALKHFDNLDEAGVEASLKAWPQTVAYLMSDYRKGGRSIRDENPLLLDKLRQLTLDALKSSRPETQKAAFEPMVLVFSDDMIVIRSREDYEFNPELQPILKRLSETHPDLGFRQRVQQILNPQSIDQMVANVLQERQTHAKDKGE